MQLLAIKLSGSTRLSGNSVRLFSIKLTSGIVMVPEMAPLALISTRSLISRVSGSVFLGAKAKLEPKKIWVSRVMSPPLPSRANARMSLSSKAMMVSALMVMLPPPPAPLKTLVLMSLSPKRRISSAVMVIAPPSENLHESNYVFDKYSLRRFFPILLFLS